MRFSFLLDSRQQRGFTLVELMVVVVIIGILAAVAVPKFSDAINKARCSEIPLNLSHIARGEELYRYEVGSYADRCAWGQGSTAERLKNGEILGVDIKGGDYIRYTANLRNSGTGFNAKAVFIKDLGEIEVNQAVILTEDNTKSLAYTTVRGGPKIRRYLGTFLKN